jgi:hypothetical protein
MGQFRIPMFSDVPLGNTLIFGGGKRFVDTFSVEAKITGIVIDAIRWNMAWL